jgi:hypothetical protein
VEDGLNVWAAVYEDGIVILDSITLQHIAKYSYSSVQTFGGAVDDHFMVVVDDGGKKRRLLFGGMSKFKVIFAVLEVKLLGNQFRKLIAKWFPFM